MGADRQVQGCMHVHYITCTVLDSENKIKATLLTISAARVDVSSLQLVSPILCISLYTFYSFLKIYLLSHNVHIQARCRQLLNYSRMVIHM